jgi:UrcA family protein
MGEGVKSVALKQPVATQHLTESAQTAVKETTVTNISTNSNSTRLRGLIAAAILGALASSLSAVCAAADAGADASDLRSIVVTYRDLNVSKGQGAAMLYGRIRAAAKSVCSVPEDADYSAKLRESPCIHKAIAEAVSAINQPELFAVYNANNRTPLPVVLVAKGAR